jgi:hypothetical protein
MTESKAAAFEKLLFMVTPGEQLDFAFSLPWAFVKQTKIANNVVTKVFFIDFFSAKQGIAHTLFQTFKALSG